MKRKPTNPITNIRTGTGDGGLTNFNDRLIPKNDPVIEFLGDLDESCSCIALINFDDVPQKSVYHISINAMLSTSKRMLFDIGAMVYSETALTSHRKLIEWYVEYIQGKMDMLLQTFPEQFPKLRGFIVPSQKNALTMVARSVVRRAERNAINAKAIWAIPALNILSDFLFLIAWLQDSENQWVGVTEN